MKKLLAVALILCLLIPYAVAETPVDVTAMSDADLKALYVSIKEELITRKLWEKAVLPAGVYVGGRDLPEGTYECVIKNEGFVIMYENYETFITSNMNIGYMWLDAGESFIMSLYDGIVYSIDEECTVRPFVGFDW